MRRHGRELAAGVAAAYMPSTSTGNTKLLITSCCQQDRVQGARHVHWPSRLTQRAVCDRERLVSPSRWLQDQLGHWLSLERVAGEGAQRARVINSLALQTRYTSGSCAQLLACTAQSVRTWTRCSAGMTAKNTTEALFKMTSIWSISEAWLARGNTCVPRDVGSYYFAHLFV